MSPKPGGVTRVMSVPPDMMHGVGAQRAARCPKSVMPDKANFKLSAQTLRKMERAL